MQETAKAASIISRSFFILLRIQRWVDGTKVGIISQLRSKIKQIGPYYFLMGISRGGVMLILRLSEAYRQAKPQYKKSPDGSY